MKEILLLPVPRMMKVEKQKCRIPTNAKFYISGPDSQRIMFLADFIKKFTNDCTGHAWKQDKKDDAFLVIICNPTARIQPQGYKLSISKKSILIEASEPYGAYYGLCTLRQILLQNKKDLPVLLIEDYPDFPHRGVMLDISRSKVPEMETLYNLVEMLSSWKINQLQLYTEHTFAYKGHEIVWQGKSPMTPEEIRKLDGFCRERFVELVPNQNSFGHFHRWLQHPQYKHLAEDPENPYTLCPVDPGSIQLLEDLYSQLLPLFTSKMFNVGCDETTLGKRSLQVIKEKGEGRVYLEFLLKIYNLVKKHGRTMQFWGDIIQRHPELIPELPKDAIVLEWGYESNHPFRHRCEKIAETALPFYVCPGTSSWNSIAGRTENCLANLVNAALNGLKTGAIGFLNTDWGDNGHWQYLPASYIGFGFGAGVSWCARTNINIPVEKTIGLFAFDDPSFNSGYLAYELGNVSTATGIHTSNASPLFIAMRENLSSPDVILWMRRKGIETAEQQLEKALTYEKKLMTDNNEKVLIRDEFRNATKLLKHACEKSRMVFDCYTRKIEPPRSVLTKLIREAEEIIEEHKRLWLKRNRPGGLEESVELLEKFTISTYNKFMK
ncbi:MAG: family 20 glycosylhydrolase [bacterium]|nr:family 20 glycosylhydrolase [bacterium]